MIKSVVIGIVAATFVASPAAAQLFGPGKFKIEQSDNRFSTDGLTTYSGRNNRISKKSVVGGVHIDGQGMYVEPVAIKRTADGSLVGVSLFIHNETEHDTAFGSGNSIGEPQRIIFVPDGGQPIGLKVASGESKWDDRVTYNTVTRSASSRIQESGFADLTPDEYRRISGASRIAVKVEGSTRAVVYEERDIAKTFLANLRAFEAAHFGGSSSTLK